MTSNGHKMNFTVEHNHDAIAKLSEMVLSPRETVLAQNEEIIGLHKEITIMKPLIAGAKQEGLWMKNIKWWENNEPIHIELLHDKCHSDDHVHDHETYTQYGEAKSEQNVKNGIYIYIASTPCLYICTCMLL